MQVRSDTYWDRQATATKRKLGRKEAHVFTLRAHAADLSISRDESGCESFASSIDTMETRLSSGISPSRFSFIMDRYRNERFSSDEWWNKDLLPSFLRFFIVVDVRQIFLRSKSDFHLANDIAIKFIISRNFSFLRSFPIVETILRDLYNLQFWETFLYSLVSSNQTDFHPANDIKFII